MIRFSRKEDIQDILSLLDQVNYVHQLGRPDIFKRGTKYQACELEERISSSKDPILVYEENGKVLGYAFIETKITKDDSILQDEKMLYIDDLCVDKEMRGKHIGGMLFQAVVEYGKANHYQRITLNVWALNKEAYAFYQKMGLIPVKTVMEKTL